MPLSSHVKDTWHLFSIKICQVVAHTSILGFTQWRATVQEAQPRCSYFNCRYFEGSIVHYAVLIGHDEWRIAGIAHGPARGRL
jgi:hypothetical protein